MKLISVQLLAFLMLCNFCSCAQRSNDGRRRENKIVQDPVVSSKDLQHYSQATFASGCFWHEEALYESVNGVVEAISGYAGGHTKNPTYESLESGNTGHAESVVVYYDSSKISYTTLLKIFFEAQEDPTQVNGQGPDHGTQYRSIIFYKNDAEKAMAEKYIADMNKSGKFNKPVAAQVMQAGTFWPAEDYHQDYIKHNSDNPYVQNVSIPDIQRFQKQHPDMIKPGHVY